MASRFITCNKPDRPRKNQYMRFVRNRLSSSLFAAAAMIVAASFAAPPAKRIPTADSFAPERTTPVQRGEFAVGLVLIAFPDCVKPSSADEVREALSNLNGGTVESYYREYSQGITWPVLEAYPAIYMAPHPLGYYCRRDHFANKLGFKDDGPARAEKLRADALKFVQSKGKLKRKPAYNCYVFCKDLNKEPAVMERYIRPFYKKPTMDEIAHGAVDHIERYNPPIPWADPLWPCSIPQVHYPGSGRTLVHEIGHCLGSPDYYHASEEHDGLEGTPCLKWDYGPTGPAYCRYIHHAFVPAATYPKITEPGDITLSPRSTKLSVDAPPPTLGVFVPSSHPNYLFYIEYCHDEKLPVGDPEAEGLLVHVINVTMAKPTFGPPDLCYTYRKDDPDHKGLGDGDAYLLPGDSFDAKSDPAAILPNLLPAGISITDIRRTDDGKCTFRLDFPPAKFEKPELDRSLLPQTRIVDLTDVLPTSFRAELNVRYRGEPLLTEYGFCYGLKKDPTEKTGTLFPLYHRDRYDARIIDLSPGKMYYVRAYARNASGIRYSENQKGIVMPTAEPGRKFEATLFGESDHLLANWYFQQWYFGTKEQIINSANPLFAFMSLVNYYRAMPGLASGAPRRRKSGGDAPLNLARVHSNPSDSRPKFRLADTNKLREAVEKMLSAAGFLQSDFIMDERGDGKKAKKSSAAKQPARGKKDPFGRLAPWVKKCAEVLKVKTTEKTFFPCRTAEEINALAPRIREWILMSQPVLVVRESEFFPDMPSQRWPLDIAIIDGLSDDATSFHVVFPGGKDRDLRSGGVLRLEELLEYTSNAIVMFYRPGHSTTARR